MRPKRRTIVILIRKTLPLLAAAGGFAGGVLYKTYLGYSPEFWSNGLTTAYIGRCLRISAFNINEIYIEDMCSAYGGRTVVPPEGYPLHFVSKALMAPTRHAILVEITNSFPTPQMAERFMLINVLTGEIERGDWAAMSQRYAVVTGEPVPKQFQMKHALRLMR